MATEQFANSAQTTLNGAITFGAMSITVQSATGFPLSPQFRILIDSELLLVTALAGTTWTVSRGLEFTTAVAHANGAAVVQVLTAGVMSSLETAAAAVAPTGSVTAYAGGTTPAGWLLCDGSAVSRTTYAALFGAIGTTWGAGDGSTTFNLPDLRGRNPLGAGQGSGLSNRTLGQTGGEETHTLTTSEMPSHTHSPGNGDPYVISYKTTAGASALANTSGSYQADLGGALTSAGGGGGHNNMQPYAVLNYLIKT